MQNIQNIERKGRDNSFIRNRNKEFRRNEILAKAEKLMTCTHPSVITKMRVRAYGSRHVPGRGVRRNGG